MNTFKPLIETNPYLRDPVERQKRIARSVRTSSAVEGINEKKMLNLVMIPGLLCDEALFRPVIDGLKNEYRIKVTDVSLSESIEDCAESIRACSDSESILIGFSYGAWVAVRCYSQLRQNCRGLVLISSAPGNLTLATRQRFEEYINQIESGDFDRFVKEDFEQDVAEINKKSSEFEKNFMSMVYRQGKEVAIKQLKSMLEYQGPVINFKEIHCPTLLMRGAEDRSINIPKQEKMLHEIPEAKLSIIPNSAHYVPLENPASTAVAIESWISAI